jgi:hypothetical protein
MSRYTKRILEMGCKSASMSKDRDERAETIREAMMRRSAIAAAVDPVNE